MKLIDNVSQTLKDDLKVEIKKGSKVSIAAACFSFMPIVNSKNSWKALSRWKLISTMFERIYWSQNTSFLNALQMKS